MDDVPCDTEDKHGSLHDVFYAVNKAQHFEFPHTNCDTYANTDLAALYFKQSGYGSYCCRMIASITGVACDLSVLHANSQFVNLVTAWMRLKFVAEQVDPVRYARYFERGIIPAHKTPKLPAELLELYKADSTEFYAFVDRLANTIQMQWLQFMIGIPSVANYKHIPMGCAELETEGNAVVVQYKHTLKGCAYNWHSTVIGNRL